MYCVVEQTSSPNDSFPECSVHHYLYDPGCDGEKGVDPYRRRNSQRNLSSGRIPVSRDLHIFVANYIRVAAASHHVTPHYIRPCVAKPVSSPRTPPTVGRCPPTDLVHGDYRVGSTFVAKEHCNRDSTTSRPTCSGFTDDGGRTNLLPSPTHLTNQRVIRLAKGGVPYSGTELTAWSHCCSV
jgi:hypothetical protein